ncbi:hypothetical protein CFR75_04095 [Komagataeibacter xylinus]|uniref:Uncharacterized protein n=1 Tax=Komagataeibacter xylinus TaxID=28448 RepID=A0A318PK79_KOMXY|nr:hypothetical protein CXP35_15075 [Komagataeibacter xylinus]PYD57922.1 hypothetical protein CFR75_04095 [Komagataeibacter xylinus]
MIEYIDHITAISLFPMPDDIHFPAATHVSGHARCHDVGAGADAEKPYSRFFKFKTYGLEGCKKIGGFIPPGPFFWMDDIYKPWILCRNFEKNILFIPIF